MKPKDSSSSKMLNFIRENSTSFVLIISSVATGGSLFFSEVRGLEPCILCWYQRIFMYPIPILVLSSYFFNDTKVGRYILVFSTIGFLIAIYHILLQAFPSAIYAPCTTESVSCVDKQIEVLGFITIPMMSASAFLLIILLQAVPFFHLKKQVKDKY